MVTPDGNKILVSVVIPMYNAETTILKCIESVIHQLPESQMEIVIVNDGSTDNSLNIVDQYVKGNNITNINLITQSNGGASKARNTGIRAARYDHIALIDSDDIWLPGKLEKQIDYLVAHPEVAFIGTLHNNLQLSFPYQTNGPIIDVTFKQLMIKMAPSTITSLFKKELIEKSGYYDESQRYAEDANLWLRFSMHGKMVILNENYAIAGDMKPLWGHSGLSGNLSKMEEGELKNIKDMYKLRYINYLEFLMYSSYSLLKYWRRCIVVRFRK